MTNNKNERREKIKNCFFKALHGISYVLSVLFIVLISVIAFQSCDIRHNLDESNNQNHVNNALHVKKSLQTNDEINDYFVYVSRYSSGLHEINDTPLLTYFDIPTDEKTSSLGSINKYIDLPKSYFNGTSGQLEELKTFRFEFRCLQLAPNDSRYYYRLYRVMLYGDSTAYYCSKNDTYANDSFFGFGANVGNLYLSQDISNLLPFTFFYSYSTQVNYFVFNKIFNYNAPANIPIGNNLWKESGLSDFEVNHYTDLNIGYFVSNGMLFDTIRYTYWCANSQMFKDDNGSFWGSNDYAFYKELRYYNSVTGDSVLVNFRNQYWEESGSLPVYYWTADTTWVNDSYRYITLLTDLNNLTRVQLESFNNNNQTTISGNVTNADTSNVFTLVGSAFTGLLPILNTMLLPGITIGMLMFVPLVAMLVFAIIRIIKK